MKFIYCFTIWIVAFNSFASTPVMVHTHKYYTEGVLPEPYGTFALRIDLDDETDNVLAFDLYRGNDLLLIPPHIIGQLKNVELSTIKISHEMHREEGKPDYNMFGDEGDWLHIDFEVGDNYRAEKSDKGKKYFKWGRDRLVVTVVKGKKVTLKKISVSDTHGYWAERTW